MIRLDALSVDFDERFQLHDVDWTLQPGQHWLITGANGSGKSALAAAALAGDGRPFCQGTLSGVPERVAHVSYERQAELIAAERRKDDADILDVISEGTPVAEIIEDGCEDPRVGAGPGRHTRPAAPDEPRLPQALDRRDPQDHVDPGAHEPTRAARCSTNRSTASTVTRSPGCRATSERARRDDTDGDRAQPVRRVPGLHHPRRLRRRRTALPLSIERDDEQAYAELYQLLHLKTSDLEIPAADPARRSFPRSIPTCRSLRLTGATVRYSENTGLRRPRLDDRTQPALAAQRTERQRQDVSAAADHRRSPAVLRQRHQRGVRLSARHRREHLGDQAVHRLRLDRPPVGVHGEHRPAKRHHLRLLRQHRALHEELRRREGHRRRVARPAGDVGSGRRALQTGCRMAISASC